MARSIRSKRGRMLRKIKRERYSVKEMKRLQNMLGVQDNVTEHEVKMCVSDIATVVDADSFTGKTEEEVEEDKKRNKILKRLQQLQREPKLNMYVVEDEVLGESDTSEDDEEVHNLQRKVDPSSAPDTSSKQDGTSDATEMDHSQKRMYDPITKTDQYGNYPIWFTQKDMKRQRAKVKARKAQLKRLEAKRKRLQICEKSLITKKRMNSRKFKKSKGK